jgi:hypothetical protein
LTVSSGKIRADGWFFFFGSKGKAYFVDSKWDEGKIRSFLKMYRSASALFSSLGFLSVLVPVWTRLISAGASPLGDKFPTFVGSSAALLLILGVSAWMLWGVYKETVPSLIASLSEVGPDLKGQLDEISQRPRPLAALLFLAAVVLLGLGVLFAVSSHR